MLEPAGIICDEPVSMLDVSVRSQILHVLLELQRARELALLFITHDLSLAWQLCDRIAVMYLGRIVEQGDARDVIERPGHPYTQALVDAVPPRKQRTPLGGELPDAAEPPGRLPLPPALPEALRALRPRRPAAVRRRRARPRGGLPAAQAASSPRRGPAICSPACPPAWWGTDPLERSRMTRSRLLFLALTLALLAVTACGGASDSIGGGSSTDKGSKSLSLVAYSTPQVVYDEIIPEFQKTGDGEGVGFKSSFGASGEQSRAVEAGLKADVVSFSTRARHDAARRCRPRGKDWNSTPNKGLVTTSVVSFIVRKGNPKNIKTWDDLLKPGVKVLTPNPFTSGAAKWNLLAGYGAKSDGGKNPEAGSTS